MAGENPLRVNVTTDADGDATSYSSYFTGKIVAVQYLKTDFANGVDFTITTETGAVNVWVDTNINAAETVWPTQPLDDGTGTNTATLGPIRSLQDRIKVVVAQGGNTKSGAFLIWYE